MRNLDDVAKRLNRLKRLKSLREELEYVNSLDTTNFKEKKEFDFHNHAMARWAGQVKE